MATMTSQHGRYFTFKPNKLQKNVGDTFYFTKCFALAKRIVSQILKKFIVGKFSYKNEIFCN